MIEIEKLLNKIPLSTIDQFNGKQVRFNDVVNLFKDKVIIQRGENRHPYADVLHEWIEGADIEFYERGVWNSLHNINENTLVKEYRIKPQEPVCVYQYAYKDQDGETCISSFMTEDEGIRLLETRTTATKLEWTKKERK